MTKKINKDFVRVIGAGLAGSEAALFLASKGIHVKLYDLKPNSLGEAQNDKEHYGELVCSNSLKSNTPDSAPGLLKNEMSILGSVMMEASKVSVVPSGQDLSVDRTIFSSFITNKIKSNPNIECISEDVEFIPDDGRLTIVSTGPLTSSSLTKWLSNSLGSDLLSFFDAAAPLVFTSSLNKEKMFEGSRWNKGEGKYLNCPMTKDQYFNFVDQLVHAERAILHDFDHFEGCLPIETMANRGPMTLKYGPLKPVGLNCSKDTFAVVQLRQDDVSGNMYGLVGFQTNLKFNEQKRVFSLIPGLENAKFARFGIMHRNTFINAPKYLNRDLTLKNLPNVFIAGQLSGVEGYCESGSSGLLAGIYAYMKLTNDTIDLIPLSTMMGSLVNYLVMASPKHFAPMNATYGIFTKNDIKDHEKCRIISEESVKEWKTRNKL